LFLADNECLLQINYGERKPSVLLLKGNQGDTVSVGGFYFILADN